MISKEKFFSIVWFLGLLLTGHAQLVISDGYRFDVQVLNRYHRFIDFSRVEVRVSGNHAEIRANARGYKDGRTSLTVSSKDQVYYTRLVLDDPWVRFQVKDQHSNSVASYVRDDGFMAFPDEYQFQIRLNEYGFENFNESDVEVKVNGLPAWMARVDVRGTGLSRRVVVSFSRRSFFGFGFNIVDVKIPKDEQLRQARSQQIKTIQFLLQNDEGPTEVLQKRLKSLR